MTTIINGTPVGYNSQWVASLSYEEFKAHEAHHGFSDKQMRMIYKLCVKEASSGGRTNG